MAVAKRKCHDASEYANGSQRKRSKTSHDGVSLGFHCNLGDCGTLASQRPKRTTRAPKRYGELLPDLPQKKQKVTETKSVVKLGQNAPPKELAVAKDEEELHGKGAAGSPESVSRTPEKKSNIVRLKISFNSVAPRSIDQHDGDEDTESTLSSPPASSPAQGPKVEPVDVDSSLPRNEHSQCAQDVPAPVPASSQDLITPDISQTEHAVIPKGLSNPWSPPKPNDSRCRKSDASLHSSHTTPSKVCSQDVDMPVAYPTPDSIKSYETQPTQLLFPPAASQELDTTQNKSKETALEGWISDQNSYQTQPTLALQQSWSIAPPLALDTSPKSSYAASDASTEVEDIDVPPHDSHLPITSNAHLHAIAEQLLAQRDTGPNKPEPHGQPEVWADGRQELCETLHYYRSYQGGCYSTGGFVRGFMFDKVAHARDYIDSNVVISRAGGGLTKDKDSGEMRAGKDQIEDTVAQGLRNCMTHCNPVVITTGLDNPHITSKPPHQYCVLDYFKPTHIWVEKSGDSKIVRYRFEKLNTKKESWWRPKDVQDTVGLGSLAPPVEKSCETCSVKSLQIYLNGWMCLQPTCASFWKIVAPTPGPGCGTMTYEPNEASLIYDPRFLKQKTPWHNDDHDYPLVSNTAELSGHAIPGENTSVSFWSGMVCPKCRRCISRLNWTGWECPNVECDYAREPPHTLISAQSLRDPLWPVTNSYTLARDTQTPSIEVKVSFAHGYRVNRYKIPGIDGFITHMVANKTVLEESGGPDSMFEELQQTDIGLQRRPMSTGQLKGPTYCRHFAVNYGMPYKFIAATASQSFDGAARPITSTRSRLNWAAKLLLTQETGQRMQEVEGIWREKEFNEVLALGYFEDQKINYHDDGEFGLGPTIATLSLGAPGTMRIRMKARHYHGVSAAGVYDDAPPIPGCQHYDARLALQPSLDALKQSDPKAYAAKRKQIPKNLGLKSRGQSKDVLTMQLGHGDIVVMHGAEVQKYFEHSVEHSGKLRFALTCRYIDPASLKQEDQPTYEVGPDLEGYDGSRLG